MLRKSRSPRIAATCRDEPKAPASRPLSTQAMSLPLRFARWVYSAFSSSRAAAHPRVWTSRIMPSPRHPSPLAFFATSQAYLLWSKKQACSFGGGHGRPWAGVPVGSGGGHHGRGRGARPTAEHDRPRGVPSASLEDRLTQLKGGAPSQPPLRRPQGQES